MRYSPIGDSWDDFETEIFTPEEIAASDLRVALINELICARNEKGITPERAGGTEWSQPACYCQNGKRSCCAQIGYSDKGACSVRKDISNCSS